MIPTIFFGLALMHKIYGGLWLCTLVFPIFLGVLFSLLKTVLSSGGSMGGIRDYFKLASPYFNLLCLWLARYQFFFDGIFSSIGATLHGYFRLLHELGLAKDFHLL